MKERLVWRAGASKKSKLVEKNKDFIPIDPEIRQKENTRCSEWHNNEADCRANKCWYYRKSKKCKAHLGILSGKPPKNASKKSYLKKSKKRSKKKRSSKKYRK